MEDILRDFRFNALTIWRRSSFSQWLIGVALLLLVWLLLYAFGGTRTAAANRHVAQADRCLQAAGSDLKHGELLVHDMNTRPCGCTAVN
jgi:hypothetical protein